MSSARLPAEFEHALDGRGTLLLGGIVGSTAYGLAHEGSDQDRLGIYVAPTSAFLGLKPPQDRDGTIMLHEPSDITVHELGKALRLLLAANPLITDLLWLPEDLYEHINPVGAELQAMRSAFVSAGKVQGAYTGLAGQVFGKAKQRAKADANDPRARKGARHALRILHQGYDLYTTGTLTPRLADPDRYLAFGELPVKEMTRVFRQESHRFLTARSVLPDQPDTAAADALLQRTRRQFLD